MVWTIRDDLRLTIRMGLTRGLRLVRGMRRKLSEEERNRVAFASARQYWDRLVVSSALVWGGMVSLFA